MATVALLMLGGIAAHAQDQPPTDPTEFLKWSMARYAALTNFQADCDWSDSFGSEGKLIGKRSLILAKPNRYRVVFQTIESAYPDKMIAVCDGKTAVEYNSINAGVALKAPVPATIASAKAKLMQNPLYCATLLYRFFDGPEKLMDLADTTRQEIAFGADDTVGGHLCKTVTFYAVGDYGKTAVAIGAGDGLVYRIRYDSEPLMAKEAENAEGHKKPTSETEEDYSHLITNGALPASAFDTTLPKGMKLLDPAAKDSGLALPKPPVKPGQRAPDFTVKTLAGQKRSLTNYRGQVILIDFWATWCQPCRVGLHEVQALSQRYRSRGLAVLAISNEDAKTVSPFLKSNHYTFQSYLDANDRAATKYNIGVLPTTVIIDRAGHLVNYLVGFQDPATIEAALKKAGLKLN